MASQSNTSVIRLEGARTHETRSQSLFQKAMGRVLRDRLTMAALGVIALLAVLSILAPVISTHVLHVKFDQQNLRNTYAPPGSPGHILGTDELGRDHLSRLLYGGQVSLAIAFCSAILSLAIGVTLGVITGYYGGIVDDIMIWFITTLNSVPSLFLLLTIAAFLAPTPLSLILILAVLGWTGTTRIVRGEAFSLREREFAIAARAVGASSWRIMFAHLLPNIFSLLIIDLMTSIGALILTESALSFLGFGVSSSTPTWGNMLSGGLDLIRTAPHLVIAPGFLITLTVLCLYIAGDGLRDAFDPRLED